MEAATALATLRRALDGAVRRAGIPPGELSAELGRPREHLPRLLDGRAEAPVHEVLEVLAVLELDADEFFRAAFPFGGAHVAEVRRPAPGPLEHPGYPSFREMLRTLQAREGRLYRTPEEIAAEAGELLRTVIRRRGTTEREVSCRLGISSGVLSTALRGQERLAFEHLFGVLEAAEMDPGRFFAELFGPADRPIIPEARWSRFLDLLERTMSGAAQGMLEQRRAADGEPEADAPEAREGTGQEDASPGDEEPGEEP